MGDAQHNEKELYCIEELAEEDCPEAPSNSAMAPDSE